MSCVPVGTASESGMALTPFSVRRPACEAANFHDVTVRIRSAPTSIRRRLPADWPGCLLRAPGEACGSRPLGASVGLPRGLLASPLRSPWIPRAAKPSTV